MDKCTDVLVKFLIIVAVLFALFCLLVLSYSKDAADEATVNYNKVMENIKEQQKVVDEVYSNQQYFKTQYEPIYKILRGSDN